MYKHETLVKFIAMGKKFVEKFENMDSDALHVCISSGNRKIGLVMNVSTAPVFACPHCKHCVDFCYDIKACLRFPKNVFENRVKNYIMATKHREKFFAEIENRIARRRTNKFFRWHVAGDIIDADYFENMVRIAKNHPDFIFWTYTKVYEIVNDFCSKNGGKAAVPDNFVIMFSEWDGVEMVNPFGFPEFSCKLKDGNKNHPVEYFDTLYKCPGNCDICKASNRGCLAGETTYADEH